MNLDNDLENPKLIHTALVPAFISLLSLFPFFANFFFFSFSTLHENSSGTTLRIKKKSEKQ